MDLQIGKNILKYRQQSGLTQEQLGEIVGVSGQAVSKWENGGIPDTFLLPKIAEAFHVSIDSLFGTQKNVAKMEEDEIEKLLFKFCLSKCQSMKYFDFLFRLLWAVQSGYSGNESYTDLDSIWEEYSDTPQITSQVINNDGTTYFCLLKDFPLFCAVKDSDKIAEKLLSETEFDDFFALLSDADGRKAVFFTQTSTDVNQYTLQGMADAIGITLEKAKQIMPLLVKYSLIAEDSLMLDNQRIFVYHKWNNPEIRSILMMAYQFIHARQCYYNFTYNRTKSYF